MQKVSKNCQVCNTNKADPTILGIYFKVCQQCYRKEMEEIMKVRRERKIKYPEIDQIYANLFLGNEDGATQKKMLDELGIKSILVCGSYVEAPYKNSYSYKIYQIADDSKEDIKQYFQDSYTWIQEQHKLGKKVLLHCHAGISRSASFTIAYVMKKQKKKFKEALKFVRSKRNEVRPNAGFLQQLLQYEQIIFK